MRTARDLREAFERLGAPAPTSPGLYLHVPITAADGPHVVCVQTGGSARGRTYPPLWVGGVGGPFAPKPGRYIALEDVFEALERPTGWQPMEVLPESCLTVIVSVEERYAPVFATCDHRSGTPMWFEHASEGGLVPLAGTPLGWRPAPTPFRCAGPVRRTG